MTIESARPPDESRPGTPSPASLRQTLRRLLRTQHRPANAGGATLSVIGLRGASARSHRLQTVPLRHALERPAQALLGLCAPADVGAVAAIAASVVTTRQREHRDAALAIAVTRAGDEVCFLASDTGIVETWKPQGWMVDACRRSLDLATTPAADHPLDLPLALWLDRLMVDLVGDQQSTSAGRWPDAASRCPVPDQWRSPDPVELGTTLSSITPSWAALRVSTARGLPTMVPVAPAHAAWMDDAMFTRWCLGFFPDVTELRSDYEFLAPPAVAAQVDAAIQAAYASWTD